MAVSLQDITPGKLLRARFQGADVLHVQHEFFMFDRWVGVSVLFYYPYLWLWSRLLGYHTSDGSNGCSRWEVSTCGAT